MTCPSHAAVDAILEKLVTCRKINGEPIIVSKLGHPVKTRRDLQKYTADAKKWEKYKEITNNRLLERQRLTEFIQEADVVLGTLVTVAPGTVLHDFDPNGTYFDLCVIDEAGQDRFNIIL